MKAPFRLASNALSQAATLSAFPYSPTLTRRDAAGSRSPSQRQNAAARAGLRTRPGPASRVALTNRLHVVIEILAVHQLPGAHESVHHGEDGLGLGS